MDYYINQTCYMSAFPVPAVLADRHLKLAKGEHIKVLLYIMRKMSTEISIEEVAENCGMGTYDVKEALLYWADAGILLPKEQTAVYKPEEKAPQESAPAVVKAQKPTRQDVARRGLEDNKISYLLNGAQAKLGRNLKSNETSTLVWLYDDQGLDVSLILFIIEYAVKNNKANMRFIESTAIDWINNGVDTIALAEEALNKITLGEQSWNMVCKAFGIEKRKASKKEAENAYKWVAEWKMSFEMLVAAYEACVDTKAKFTMPYVSAILENWHNSGYTSPEDIEKKKPETTEEAPTYNLDLYEELMKSKGQG